VNTPLEKIIRKRAYRRFIQGFPPRKGKDTSFGDAINWEWIVHCAIESTSEFIIVSRDSDYGVTFDKKSFLNDCLLQEFRDRVSQNRQVMLFTRLSEALKLFKVRVSEEEQSEEEALAKSTLTAADYYKVAQEARPNFVVLLDEAHHSSLRSYLDALKAAGVEPHAEKK
jgi:hypothetical protein